MEVASSLLLLLLLLPGLGLSDSASPVALCSASSLVCRPCMPREAPAGAEASPSFHAMGPEKVASAGITMTAMHTHSETMS